MWVAVYFGVGVTIAIWGYLVDLWTSRYASEKHAGDKAVSMLWAFVSACWLTLFWPLAAMVFVPIFIGNAIQALMRRVGSKPTEVE